MAGADRMAVEDVVRKVLVDEHADVLREPLRWSVARLMEVEVCEVIGAEHGQRTPDRAAHRNGYRAREWQTRAGTVERTNPSTSELVHEPRSLLLRRAHRSPAACATGRLRVRRSIRRPSGTRLDGPLSRQTVPDEQHVPVVGRRPLRDPRHACACRRERAVTGWC
jgi:hypothetical protein